MVEIDGYTTSTGEFASRSEGPGSGGLTPPGRETLFLGGDPPEPGVAPWPCPYLGPSTMAPPGDPDRPPSGAGAAGILAGCVAARSQSGGIPRRAPARFERRHWHGMPRDARELPAPRDDEDALCAEPWF